MARPASDRSECWVNHWRHPRSLETVGLAIIDMPGRRDRASIPTWRKNIWCNGIASITTRLYDLGGRLNKPISVGGVAVMPGDAVLCDDSGVLVLPPGEAESEAHEAIRRQKHGLATQARLARGDKLGEISGASARVLADHP